MIKNLKDIISTCNTGKITPLFLSPQEKIKPGSSIFAHINKEKSCIVMVNPPHLVLPYTSTPWICMTA
jgi:hypothetical protein